MEEQILKKLKEIIAISDKHTKKQNDIFTDIVGANFFPNIERKIVELDYKN